MLTLNREMTQGPQEDQMWRFGGTITHEDSNVDELFHQSLPHEVVAEIYDDVMGGLPGSGLELADVLENWDALEPDLKAEIEHRMPPEAA